MLQKQFENYDYTPLFYKETMDNMHEYFGNGWYGITTENEYVGWDSHSEGSGCIFPGDKVINYNLIFIC